MEEKQGLVDIIKNHPVLTAITAGAAALAVWVTYSIATAREYSPLAEATVIEEVAGGDANKTDTYLLRLKVKEEFPTPQERVYTLNVAGKDPMPLSVLAKVLEPGSTVFFPYLKQGYFYGDPQQIFKVSSFGSVNSTDLFVVDHWRTSEEVRKDGETTLQRRQDDEARRARQEAHLHYGAKWAF